VLYPRVRAPVGNQLGTLLDDENDLIWNPDLSAGVPTGEVAEDVGLLGDSDPSDPGRVIYATLPPSTNAGTYRWLDLAEVWD